MYKKIPEFPKYEISTRGSIRTVDKHRPVRPRKDESGYMKVDLKNKNGRSTQYVHRLVASVYVPNPDNKKEINHKDGNEANNSVGNLEWMDKIDNIIKARKINKLGEKHIILESNRGQGRKDRYRVQITRDGKKVVDKSFSAEKYTLEDVKKERDRLHSECI